MPYKYVARNLKGNSYYHIYNMGVAKNDIFLDDADYRMFVYYLDVYTTPSESVNTRFPGLSARLRSKNLGEEVKLIAYSLLPNHFHLVIKQKSSSAMPQLLKQLTNGYTMYFNTKYNRRGRIFNGRYRATLIESEYLLVQMVRYVHINCSLSKPGVNFKDYEWSSYKNPLTPNELLNRYRLPGEWEKFHEDYEAFQVNLPKIKNLVIE